VKNCALGSSHTSLWSERAIFRRKMLSERPGHWAKLKHHFVPNVYLTELIYISLLGNVD